MGTGAPGAAVGKEQAGMAMRLPEAAQRRERGLWQRYESVAVAFGVAHLHAHALGVDVGHRERKALAQPQAETVKGEVEHPIAQHPSGQEQPLRLIDRDDVGTGAGFPGLPLAIVNPQLRFTLFDSIQKKIRFVEHAATALGLDNVRAIAVRAEAHRPEQRATTVVSRALSALPAFVEYAGHLCTKQGRLLAMKGRHPIDEIAALPRGWRHRVERLHVPGLDDERTLVILERDEAAKS